MKSIHSWNQIREVFLLSNQNYNYDELCLEMDNIFVLENEFVDAFCSRFIFLFCRFHPKYLPSKPDSIEWFYTHVYSIVTHDERNVDEHSMLIFTQLYVGLITFSPIQIFN